MENTLKFVGVGCIVQNKNTKWILLKDKTDKKRYEQARQNGLEVELYGIQTEQQTKKEEDMDDLFAFKE